VFYVRMASLPPLIVQAQYHTNKINVAIHLCAADALRLSLSAQGLHRSDLRLGHGTHYGRLALHVPRRPQRTVPRLARRPHAGHDHRNLLCVWDFTEVDLHARACCPRALFLTHTSRSADATYFFLLDPIAGGLYAPILLSLGHLGNRFLLERPDAVQKLGLINAGGWVLQVRSAPRSS